MEEKDIEFYVRKEHDKATEDTTKHYFGVNVENIEQGLSFGMCLSYERYLGEFYLYINLFKWSISIGRLSRENDNDEEL